MGYNMPCEWNSWASCCFFYTSSSKDLPTFLVVHFNNYICPLWEVINLHYVHIPPVTRGIKYPFMSIFIIK